MSSIQNQCTIFIVDDDEAVRDSLRWLLEANAYQVKCHASAEAFLNSYDPKQLAVLIVDVRMPGMSGLELQEAILARDAKIPMVYITGHGDVPMHDNSMKKGTVEYLEKPSKEADL